MEGKKLTDEEIKKALECMAGITQRDCDKCPFLINKFCSDTKLSTATLDFIHRLQAENNELLKLCEKTNDEMDKMRDEKDKQLLEQKADIELLTKVLGSSKRKTKILLK